MKRGPVRSTTSTTHMTSTHRRKVKRRRVFPPLIDTFLGHERILKNNTTDVPIDDTYICCAPIARQPTCRVLTTVGLPALTERHITYRTVGTRQGVPGNRRPRVTYHEVSAQNRCYFYQFAYVRAFFAISSCNNTILADNSANVGTYGAHRRTAISFG